MAVKVIRVTKNPLPMPQARLVQGDANTQVLRFLVKKDYGGKDLTGLIWSVWVLGERGEAEVSLIGSGTVSGDDIQLDWKVIPAATRYPGVTEFKLMGSNAGSAGTEYNWVSGKMFINVAESEIDPGYDEEEIEALRQLIYEFGTDKTALNARMDTIVSAETVDKELIDIRTGANNVTYASAGTAVRTQIRALNKDIIGTLYVNSKGVLCVREEV